MKSSLTLPRLGALFTICLFLGFGIFHITQFVTADEHYWTYERIPAYFEAVKDFKWKKTFINDKPGISLALIAGTGLAFVPQPELLITEHADRTIEYATHQNDTFYLAFRLPILFVNAILLTILFFVIARLTTEWIALLTIFFTATSPMLVGMSQIVNPDALLWSFSSIALFGFLTWLRFHERKWFVVTLGCTTFALLSKYVALLLFPLFTLFILGRFFAHTEQPMDQATQELKRDILALFGVCIGSITLASIFFPALWIKLPLALPFLKSLPLFLSVIPLIGTMVLIDIFWNHNRFLIWIKHLLPQHMNLSVARGLALLLIAFLLAPIILRALFPEWDIFTQIPFDIKDITNARYYTAQPNFFEVLLLEWTPVSFTLTPLVLIGCILANSSVWRSRAEHLPSSLLFFCLIFPVLFAIANILLTPRYAITLYPLFAFIAAIGFTSLWKELLANSQILRILAAAILILGALTSLVGIAPFYINYANAFLPKSALVSDAWGYGGFEAAQYMNSLPNANNITVWSDYYGFCEFFVGRCVTAYTFDPQIVQPEYYVLTRRGEIRFRSRAERWERLSGLVALRYYTAPNPLWELTIDGRPGNFIKIYRVR